MYRLSLATIDSCVSSAVPHIKSHLMSKIENNHGFSENPQARHPVTKALTANLDKNTRLSVEEKITEASGLDSDTAKKHIRFIRACMSSVDFWSVRKSVDDDESAEHLWEIIDTRYHRDGTLFLQWIDEYSNDDEKTMALKFVDDAIKST